MQAYYEMLLIWTGAVFVGESYIGDDSFHWHFLQFIIQTKSFHFCLFGDTKTTEQISLKLGWKMDLDLE